MLHLHRGGGTVRPHVSELVINWHITEACDYRCHYCYAKWDGAGRELLHDWDRTRKLLDEIQAYFHPANLSNPLRQQMSWSGVRLNLAGGEPLLYQQSVLRMLRYAKAAGMSTSIITNGSRFNENLIDRLAPLVSMLGISLDSTNPVVNQGIGRADNRGLLLDVDAATEMLVRARLRNPAMRLKLNTVVNALNHHEDMGRLIQTIAPHRWKVFRMLEVVTRELAVSSEQFHAFVARHEAFQGVMCAEDNDEMSESYIMIDPLGRFFQNTTGQQGYDYSRPIDAIGAARAFHEWRFVIDSYTSRYRTIRVEERR
jgi:radical S-adenosyl methionine domain-containing protein 2